MLSWPKQLAALPARRTALTLTSCSGRNPVAVVTAREDAKSDEACEAVEAVGPLARVPQPSHAEWDDELAPANDFSMVTGPIWRSGR